MTGEGKRESERVRRAALLTLAHDKRAVEAFRPHQGLGRLTRHVADVPRMATQLVYLQRQSVHSTVE